MAAQYPWTMRASTMSPSYDGAAQFADPFVDVASTMLPLSVPAMLRHAEYMAVTNETFREALNRVAAYFITDLVVKGDLGDDERDKQKNFLEKDMRIMAQLVEATISHLTYGNQYTSVIQPIVRYLVCPQCSTQYRLADWIERPEFRLRLDSVFKATCQSCRYDGHMGGGVDPSTGRPDGRPKDIPDDSRAPVFVSWNPHDIRPIWVESERQTVEYHWVIPADFRTEVRMASQVGGNKAVLCRTPWEHIKAVISDQNVRFTDEYIHHWYEPRLAGLRFRGYGVPRAIINYRQLFYTQVLRRMNEVLALGHVIPIRVVSPGNTAGRGEEGDILRTTYLGDVRSRWNQIVENHRADPNSISFSPIPLQMNSLGADARALTPADILTQANDTLLNGAGVPTDFYRMNMQTQTAPVALRLIERYWAPLVSGLNELLSFVARRMQVLKKWEKAEYTLASVRLVDSIELNQLRVQMAQAGLLSRSTAMEAVDAKFRDETRKKLEDMRIEQKEQAEFQRETDAFSFGQQLAEATPAGGLAQGQPQPGGAPAPQDAGGQPPAGAAPGTPPGADPLAGVVPQEGQKIDPQELESRAEAAAQVLVQMPENVRFGKLQEIREANQLFHGLVKAKMEKLRSKARSAGQQLVLQNPGAAGGQPQ